MATGLHEANTLPDADYSIPHRHPPPIPPPSAPPPSMPPPAIPNENANSRLGRQHQRDVSGESTEEGSGRRRGSFGFLRRSSSANRTGGPATRIAQAHREAAIAAAEGRQSEDFNDGDNNKNNNSNNNTSSSGLGLGNGIKMLRKHSKAKAAQAEQERQAKAQEAAARPIPRLPSQLLPNVQAGMAGDEQRPDSVAIFSGHGQGHGNAQHSHPPQYPNPNSNFSRPVAAMPPSNQNKYSSPATGSSSSYGARSSPMPGNAFAAAQQSSSMSSVTNGVGYVPDSDRLESMTNRGRYSIGSASTPVNVNSPRRVRRRKDPTPFNVLVLGAKNSGKTSFISFLQHTLSLPAHKQASVPETRQEGGGKGKSTSFSSTYIETEMNGERVGLTLWDSAGLEKNIVDLQLREVTAFIEAKFEDTFTEEQKVNRSPGAKDTHIHCVFLVLDPVRLDGTVAVESAGHKDGPSLTNIGCLDDDFDLQVMRALWGKTTVIPVVSKADTLTIPHLSFLKRAVWQSMQDSNINPLEALDLELDSDEDTDEDAGASDSEISLSGERAVRSPSVNRTDDSIIDNLVDRSSSDSETRSSSPPHPAAPTPRRPAHARQTSRISNLSNPILPDSEEPFLPFSMLSPDPYDLPPYTTPPSNPSTPLGRRFPWGTADPLNPAHCDFPRLRESIFTDWRAELREASRDKWYEQWRTTRLKNIPGSRQRIRGGVTPVAAVPKEGRGSPSAGRNGGVNGSQNGAGSSYGVGRSASVAATSSSNGFSQVGMAVTTPGDMRESTRMVSAGSGRGEVGR
ncbi:hypothetical protein MBLNU230_g6880t1 [Neophaeotheca triangularis]